ncbi:hypothetical protein BOX15_Mlig002212g1 [Macrostomum lignano]|uniref:BACK domain-containing protein n=2 Tax=Macrostomum lignano TaxID=282301 RepID=A0A267E6E6_9PLAT|nr:hypothetical protein BOX15_Mlig002212g1 [Macrostomum lignano]
MHSHKYPGSSSIDCNLLAGFEPNLMRHRLIICGQIIKVHMHSLVTKSYFFYERCLRHGESEEPLVVTESDICCLKGLELLLYFCHFDRVRDMSISLIQEALVVARVFECSSLLAYTESFIRTNLSVTTICDIWQQVKVFSATGLPAIDAARDFLLVHFLTAAKRPEFMEFSAETIVELLRDKRLNAWSEDSLVEPLLGWLSNRLTPLWDQMCLLAALRFDLLSPASQRALSHMDAYQYFSSFRRSKMFKSLCRHAGSPRLTHECLLLLGGWDSGVFSTRRRRRRPEQAVRDPRSASAYLIDPRSGLATLCDRLRLPEPRSDFACCRLQSVLIVAGGRWREDEETNTSMALDLSSQQLTWIPIAALHDARAYMSATVCNSAVFVIGGMSASEGCFATVEALEADECRRQQQHQMSSLSQLRWKLKAPLPRARSSPGVVCIDGAIIACGGYLEPHLTQPCRLVDLYSAAEDQWTQLNWGLVATRGSPSMLALGHGRWILVLGGSASVEAEWLRFQPGLRPVLESGSAVSLSDLQRIFGGDGVPLSQRAGIACAVDSRWMLATRNCQLNPTGSVSTAIPIDELEQVAASAAAAASADQEPASVISKPRPNWLQGLGLMSFGVAAVPVSARLLEGAEFF